jgi:type VI secretion system secreted protein Hcp
MALFDAFLKLDGIKGESADAKHKGEIDISSFSWGMQQTGVQATGGGGGAGKVHVHDIEFIKKTDSSSPLLMLNCASGAHIKEANFVVRKAGGEQLEYMKIKLTDVLVSSYKPAGNTVNWGDGSYEWIKAGATAADDWEATSGGTTAADDWTLSTALAGGDAIPMESFSLNFAKVEFAYQPQGADGKAQGGPILAGWDVKANKKA